MSHAATPDAIVVRPWSPLRRYLLLALLYFSEGAPIGYIWWAMPTKLLVAGGLSLVAIPLTLLIPTSPPGRGATHRGLREISTPWTGTGAEPGDRTE